MSKVVECRDPSSNVDREESSSLGEISKEKKGLFLRTVDKVRVPVQGKVIRGLNKSRHNLGRLVNKTGNIINIAINVSVAAVLTVAASLFLYSTFYYSYMPLDTHEADLNFEFLSCGDALGLCSFPNATANISPRKRNLMPGQRYSFSLQLEMPDSPTNQDLGMFMTCLSLKDINGHQLNNICRSSILEFRSELLRVIETFVLFPLFMIGSLTQRQWITVHYYDEFIDNTHNPAFTATIHLQSKFIQVYSGQLRIAANLSGLRSMMYHHPWMSAIVGVTFNIFIISILVIMSWRSLSHTNENKEDVKDNREESEEEEKVEKLRDAQKYKGLEQKEDRLD